MICFYLEFLFFKFSTSPYNGFFTAKIDSNWNQRMSKTQQITYYKIQNYQNKCKQPLNFDNFIELDIIPFKKIRFT